LSNERNWFALGDRQAKKQAQNTPRCRCGKVKSKDHEGRGFVYRKRGGRNYTVKKTQEGGKIIKMTVGCRQLRLTGGI